MRSVTAGRMLILFFGYAAHREKVLSMDNAGQTGKLEGGAVGLSEDREPSERELEGCRWTREALRNREEQYRILVETMNDGLVILDENGVVSYMNRRGCDMLGYGKQEVIGMQVMDFLDAENQSIAEKQLSRRQQGGREIYEMTVTGKQGRRIDVIVSPQPIFDTRDRFKGSFAVLTDVTRAKQVEKELRESEQRLRLLSFHLLKVQEEEDQRISRELHDELGQDLAVLKFQIRFILKKLRRDQKVVKESCDDALEHLNQVMEKVRRISRGLVPAGVKHFGLTAALEQMVEDFAKHSQTQAIFQTENIDPVLAEQAQANVYRIFREALTNIARHATATRVALGIARQDRRLAFWLEDNGKGFDVQQATAAVSANPGLGLITMQERARMLGGNLEIRSLEGQGTRISLTLALP